MAIQLGQFLINKKKITAKQLKQVLSLQAEEHHKFGEIAGFFGLMTDEQVAVTLKAMTEKKHAEKRFGEIARELNFLTSGNIDEIRKIEEELNNRIGKMFVMSGYITQEEFDKFFQEYKELN